MTSHMKKKKVKRYQEGGEAEDKKRGLAASNKEGSVGFFERLRMGNIDDPKSEAYKRFGAGRGKAETTKQKEAIKVVQGSANPFQGGDVDPFSAVRKPSGEIMREPAKEPAKTPAKAKPAIVTKEQLKASGFDNLRDYLNDKRGLKRRVTKDSEGKTASGMPREARGTQDEGDAGEAEARKALADSRAKERAKRNQITDPGLTQSQAAAQRTAEVKRDSAKTGSQRLAEKADRAGNIYARGQAPRQSDQEKQAAARKKLGTVPPRPPRGFSSPASRKAWDDKYGDQYEPSGRKKPGAASKGKDEMGDYTPFRKGGTVSSASRRGDGIAMRGKTRGRMV
jgi:hypothetical protein